MASVLPLSFAHAAGEGAADVPCRRGSLDPAGPASLSQALKQQIRKYAREGQMDELQKLEASGSWVPMNPVHAKIAINGAEANGQMLLRLLGTFETHVSRTLAATCYKKATSQLRLGLNHLEGGKVSSVGPLSLDGWPPPNGHEYFPTLLANFLNVDDPCVDAMVDDIVVQKQIMLTSTSGERLEAIALTRTMDFPQSHRWALPYC